MTSKGKVTIETPAGTKELTGDTVICFTVDRVREFSNSKDETIDASVAYVGLEMPEELFSDLMGALICDAVENTSKNMVMASFRLYSISRILKEKSDELVRKLAEGEKEPDFTDLIDLLRGDFRRND